MFGLLAAVANADAAEMSRVDAIRCLHKAVETFQEMGRLQMAARHLKVVTRPQGHT